MQQLKRIAVIGPESTGKSTLCEMLAAHYRTIWCPEYAREYLLKNGKEYSFDDLIHIAKGQTELEESLKLKVQSLKLENIHQTSKTKLLFIDTDMYVMKVWCEYVFNKCHHFILEEIAKRKYDLYLLCNTDLPWVADELREYPDEKNRLELFHIYKDIVVNQSTPWVEITGNDEHRLQQAVKAVDELMM
jgi:NadR type nicotinamide-nucleotide adenylyltransferase